MVPGVHRCSAGTLRPLSLPSQVCVPGCVHHKKKCAQAGALPEPLIKCNFMRNQVINCATPADQVSFQYPGLYTIISSLRKGNNLPTGTGLCRLFHQLLHEPSVWFNNLFFNPSSSNIAITHGQLSAKNQCGAHPDATRKYLGYLHPATCTAEYLCWSGRRCLQ